MIAKICPLQIGMIIGVNYVIMSQEKSLAIGKVVRTHGITVMVKNVKKHVENLATHAQVSSRLQCVLKYP